MTAVLTELQRRFPAVLQAWALPAGADMARRYGTGAEDRLYLIRPDGYVGFRGAVSDAPRVAAHLQELLRPAA
jgi:hypothetical protein